MGVTMGSSIRFSEKLYYDLTTHCLYNVEDSHSPKHLDPLSATLIEEVFNTQKGLTIAAAADRLDKEMIAVKEAINTINSLAHSIDNTISGVITAHNDGYYQIKAYADMNESEKPRKNGSILLAGTGTVDPSASIYFTEDCYYDSQTRTVYRGNDCYEIKNSGLLIEKAYAQSSHFLSYDLACQQTGRERGTLRNDCTIIRKAAKALGLSSATEIIKNDTRRGGFQLHVFKSRDVDGPSYEQTIELLRKQLFEAYYERARFKEQLEDKEGRQLGWFDSASSKMRESFTKEIANQLDAIWENTQSVLTEYSNEMVIRVNDWPKKPFHVTRKLNQRHEGSGSNVLEERFLFPDELRASSFRYTAIVISDEDGEVFRIRNLPQFSPNIDVSEVKRSLAGLDANITCKIVNQRISSRKRPAIEYLLLTAEKDGYEFTLRDWDYYSARYEWEGVEDGSAPEGSHNSGFYAADVRVTAANGRHMGVELTCEYDSWSIGHGRYFTEPVYAPSIDITLEGAEDNEDYNFKLRQFSSQSPFWRRTDGNHYVQDLQFGTNTPHHLAWQYKNQWLMIGEGYSVVLETTKCNKGDDDE